MGVRWGSVRSPLGFLGSLGSPLGVLGTSRGPRVELEGLLVGLLVALGGLWVLFWGIWWPPWRSLGARGGLAGGGSWVCIVYKTRRVVNRA